MYQQKRYCDFDYDNEMIVFFDADDAISDDQGCDSSKTWVSNNEYKNGEDTSGSSCHRTPWNHENSASQQKKIDQKTIPLMRCSPQKKKIKYLAPAAHAPPIKNMQMYGSPIKGSAVHRSPIKSRSPAQAPAPALMQTINGYLPRPHAQYNLNVYGCNPMMMQHGSPMKQQQQSYSSQHALLEMRAQRMMSGAAQPRQLPLSQSHPRAHVNYNHSMQCNVNPMRNVYGYNPMMMMQQAPHRSASYPRIH